jgi:hypothetical protein
MSPPSRRSPRSAPSSKRSWSSPPTMPTRTRKTTKTIGVGIRIRSRSRCKGTSEATSPLVNRPRSRTTYRQARHQTSPCRCRERGTSRAGRSEKGEEACRSRTSFDRYCRTLRRGSSSGLRRSSSTRSGDIFLKKAILTILARSKEVRAPYFIYLPSFLFLRPVDLIDFPFVFSPRHPATRPSHSQPSSTKTASPTAADAGDVLFDDEADLSDDGALFLLPSEETQRTWYPSLRKTLSVLSEIHTFIDVSPFASSLPPPSFSCTILFHFH